MSTASKQQIAMASAGILSVSALGVYMYRSLRVQEKAPKAEEDQDEVASVKAEFEDFKAQKAAELEKLQQEKEQLQSENKRLEEENKSITSAEVPVVPEYLSKGSVPNNSLTSEETNSSNPADDVSVLTTASSVRRFFSRSGRNASSKSSRIIKNVQAKGSPPRKITAKNETAAKHMRSVKKLSTPTKAASPAKSASKTMQRVQKLSSSSTTSSPGKERRSSFFTRLGDSSKNVISN